MRAIIVLVVLGLTATSVMSDCAAADALTGILTTAVGTSYVPTLGTTGNEIAVTGAGAVTATAGSACGWANTVKLCAVQATILADIQKYINYQKTAMENAAGVRDEYIIAQRGEVVKILSSLRRLNELEENSEFTVPTLYLAYANRFIDYADTIASNFTDIVENFEEYQAQRALCMNALLKTQAGILCQVLVDNGASAMTGLTHGASPQVVLDDTFLGTVNAQCFSYIQYSARQSAIILTAAYSKGIAKLVSGIEALANSDATTAATDLASAFTTFGGVTFSSTPSQVPSKVPEATGAECTATSCALWIEDLFPTTTGVLSQADAVRGGEAVPSFTWTGSRVLSEGKERRLAATGGLAITLATFDNFVTTSFKTNPGEVDNTENANSAFRNGIVTVAVAALALVF